MRVGVPKEIKNHEYRVGLTTASVAELVACGHEVLVETQAGMGIDFSDQAYKKVGAKILATAAEVFDKIGHDREGQGAAAAKRSQCSSRGIYCSPISTSPPTSRRPKG